MCAFLDGGSTATLIDQSLVNTLGLALNKSSVAIKGISGTASLVFANAKVSFTLRVDDTLYEIQNALVVSNLGRLLPSQYISPELIDKCFEATRVQLNVLHDPPSILIGQDHCGLIRVFETRSVFHEHLAVSRCKLGWSLHGRV